MRNKGTKEKGAAMIIVVLFFIILSATLLIGVSTPISNQIKGTNEFLISKSSYTIADSQVENSLYRFNKGKNDAPSELSLLDSTANAVLTETSDGRSLVVQGSKSFFDRYVKAIFQKGEGYSFNYGIQVGNGGLQMTGSSYVTGNVYSNGDISGSTGGGGPYKNYITGTAIAATLSNPNVSFSISSSTAAYQAYSIGQTDTNQDVSQSFVTATTTGITQITFLIKKTGIPANATVKIVNNNSGVPGSTLITSGTLNASLVTTSFAYISAYMSTTVPLSANATYWIVIDNGSNDASNYYSVAAYDGVYSTGTTKQGKYGTSMVNLSTTTLDFDLGIFVGGDPGVILNVGVGTSGTGDAWANTVTGSTVVGTGSLFCQIGSGNNKVCDTSKIDPVAVAYPISQGNINDWKDQATAGGATTTNLSVPSSGTSSLGPIKINGNLTISSADLILTGPIYVTGNVTIDGGSVISADPTLAAFSALIIADGVISVTGSGGISGSGTYGSYVMLISDKSCTTTANCIANPSITVAGSSGTVVLYAINGGVTLSGSSNVKSIVAKLVYLQGGANITYETGLANMSFTSGPSGSWNRKSWKEVLGW